LAGSYKPGETFAEIGLGCAARQAGDLDLAEKALTNVLTALRHSDHGAGVADAIVHTELGFIAELRVTPTPPARSTKMA
jgi:hypothetical protein